MCWTLSRLPLAEHQGDNYMTRTSTPLPEAVDGRRWDVQEGSGSCDTVQREMRVPLGVDAASRSVRNHEMAHAKITPRVSAIKQCTKFGVSMEALQVCEDMRVSLFLRSRGIRQDCVVPKEQTADMVRRNLHSDRMLASFLVGTMHTADYDNVVAALNTDCEPERVTRLTVQTQQIARCMDGARGIFRPIGLRNATIPAARLFDALFPESGSASIEVPFEAIAGFRRGRSVKWGRLSVAELPMSMTRAIPALARQKTYRDEGVNLSAVHRLPIDGRIFSRTRSHRGGTVLIDGSGSMSLSEQDLNRIVTTAPAATIAIYSGSGRAGTLTVIGRKGRAATTSGLHSARHGNGNIVDGPALQWLAKQQTPRLWVSDGHVTGCHDRTHPDLAVDAQLICNKAGIRRVTKTDAVCDFLRAARSRA